MRLMVRIMTIQTTRFPPHCPWRILSIARRTLQPTFSELPANLRRALLVVLHFGRTERCSVPLWHDLAALVA